MEAGTPTRTVPVTESLLMQRAHFSYTGKCAPVELELAGTLLPEVAVFS